MEEIYSRDQGRGEIIIEWCNKCGSIVRYYSDHGPSVSDWRHLTKTIHSDSKDNVNKNIGQTLRDMGKM